MKKSLQKSTPENWRISEIGKECYIEMGNSPPGESYNQKEEGKPFLQGAAALGEVNPEGKKYTSDATKLCKKDDILITVRAGVGQLNIADKEYCIGRGIAAIRSPDHIIDKYLYYYLKGKEQYWNQVSSGTTYDSINQSDIKETPLPIPPLKEQQKIVSKIEELLTQLESGINDLENVDKKMSVYKESLLSYAINGKLTKNWRKDEEVTDGDLDIPKTWEWKKVGNLTNVTVGHVGSTKEHYVDDGIPVLSTKNIDLGSLDLSKLRYFSEEFHKSHSGSSLSNGDIIVARHGESGEAAVVEDIPKGQALNVIIVRSSDNFDSKYLCYLLNSPDVLSQLDDEKTGSVQKVVNTKTLANFEIPLPPIKEQRQIVERYELLSSSLFKNQDDINEQKAKADRLRESILNRAFKGKLASGIEEESTNFDKSSEKSDETKTTTQSRLN